VDAVFGRPASEGISLAMVVVHRGEVVAERYGVQPATVFGPEQQVGPDTPLISWSIAKSITHAAVGVLVGDGLVDLDAAAPVPEWRNSPKERITLLDLLEMRPGLRFVEDYVDGETSHCLAMLFGEGARDHAAYAADDVAEGVEAFLRERLFEPAGMRSARPRFDEAGTWVGSSYVDATAGDFARFGELYRRDGVAVTGRRVLPAGWSDHARTVVAHDDTSLVPGGFDYGRHWWMWPRYPGSIAAHGYEGQYVVVVPDRELTVVHLGKTPAEARHQLVARLDALIADVPIGGAA
jgi:CubicO group peptidase (beta-lactamase class C family)